MLKLATTESSFSFDKKLYKQIDGNPMGSPLGPTLANAFLCHYEKIWLNECPQFKPVVYRFKPVTCSLKFTFETEDLNNFSFLDVKITRKNKWFVTSIFGKAAFSGVFTNYDSFNFDTCKIGLVHMLLFRFFKICSIMEKFSYRSRTPEK